MKEFVAKGHYNSYILYEVMDPSKGGFSLSDFLEYLDVIECWREEQSGKYRARYINADGSAGQKIYNYIKKNIRGGFKMNKAKRFRELLNREGHFFLMEAHDGLSSKIVEETGFPAIWASGLSITASLGVRDNNEISYTQLLDVLEYMNDATELPILVDGDTGYGNFNNACRLFAEVGAVGYSGSVY